MTFELVDTNKIHPPHYKFRDVLGKLEELKASIKSHGLIEPILVRPTKGGYELVLGHRRWMATRELGEEKIMASVRELTDQEAFILALTENITREDLNPIEEARSFKDYTDSLGYGSITQLASTIKKSPSFIVRRLELLKNEDVIPMIQTGKLSVSDAEELIGLDNEKAAELADIAIKSDLTTTQIGIAKRWVKQGLNPEQAVSQVLQFGELMPKKSEHYDPVKVAREGIYLTLTQALHDIDNHILMLPEGEERAEWTHSLRSELHDLTNVAIRIKRKYSKNGTD